MHTLLYKIHTLIQKKCSLISSTNGAGKSLFSIPTANEMNLTLIIPAVRHKCPEIRVNTAMIHV